MTILSTRILVSIAAVVDIANSEGRRVAAKDISSRMELPKRYLEPTLQILVHDGILKGTRGPRGGYVLGRAPEHIFLHDIISAVTNGKDHSQKSSDKILARAIALIAPVEKMFADALAKITIVDMIIM